ncbi:hypothetical protein RKD46_006353 [Streptomyces pseudovenezuelae]
MGDSEREERGRREGQRQPRDGTTPVLREKWGAAQGTR